MHDVSPLNLEKKSDTWGNRVKNSHSLTVFLSSVNDAMR